MILTAAAFAALAGTCAPGIAAKDLAAFAKVESSFDTLAIGDNTDPKPYRAETLEEAVGIAKRLLAAGHSLDLGLMQINAANFNWLGLTVESSFDPCESMRAATMHLQATSIYNTGSPTKGFTNSYVQRVLAARQDPSGPAAAGRAPVARTVAPAAKAAPPPTELPRGRSLFATNEEPKSGGFLRISGEGK